MRFGKKLLTVALVFMMVFAMLPIVAFASDTITVTIDGVAVDFEDQEPIMAEGGRVLVPVRFVFMDLGFDVDWSRSTRTATLTRDDFTVVIVIGETTFTINDESFELDVPAQLIDGRTMVPLGPILREMGYDLSWSRSAQLVTIVSPEEEIETPELEIDLSIFDVLDEAALSLMPFGSILEAVNAYENADIIQAAAEDGFALAQMVLGMMYSWGVAVEQDFDLALEMHILAHEQGITRATFFIGDLNYWALENPEQSVLWIREAAELGNGMAQLNMAIFYHRGDRGLSQNYEQTAYWYLLAADQGAASAMLSLGVLHELGNGVEQSYELAYEWYLQAAELDAVVAFYNLGRLYFYGNGVAQDSEQAIYWFGKVLELGFDAADDYLAELGASLIGIILGVDYTILPEEFYFGDGENVTTWNFLELHGEIDLARFTANLFYEFAEVEAFNSEQGDVILSVWWDGSLHLWINLGDGDFFFRWIPN